MTYFKNVIIQDLGLAPDDFEPDASPLVSFMANHDLLNTLMNILIRNLFDPSCFEPDVSTLAILEHDTFTRVHLISSLNPGNGK